MANWLHREATWRGPLRWRIRQAWWMLFNGQFDLSVEYRFDEDGEDGVSVWVSNQRIMAMPKTETGDK